MGAVEAAGLEQVVEQRREVGGQPGDGTLGALERVVRALHRALQTQGALRDRQLLPIGGACIEGGKGRGRDRDERQDTGCVSPVEC